MVCLDLLKIIPDLVKYKNISKAASRANLSQPALSQKIINTEKEFGVKLFQRSYKGIELTEEGEIFYKHTLAILRNYDTMVKEIDQLQSSKNSFHILTTPIVCSYILPTTFYQNHLIFPKYTLEIESMASNEIEDTIACGHADIGVIIGKPENPDLIAKKVWTDPHFLVCHKDLEIPDEVTIDDLYNYNFIMLNKKKKTRKLLDKHLKNIDVELEKLTSLYEFDSNEAVKSYVLHGHGIAFLPSLVIKTELEMEQIRVIKVENFNFFGEYYIIHQKLKDPISPQKRNFITYFEKLTRETTV